jgi:hypothetical protein
MISLSRTSLSPRRRQEKLKFGKKAGMLLLFLTIYFFVNVWQNASITHLIRRNESLHRELTQIKRQCDAMLFELEQLKSPERLRQALKSAAPISPAKTITIQRGQGK